MNYTLVVIFSFSIAIPAIIGCIRFRKIDTAYYPFIFLICLGLLNETISFLITRSGYSNAINANIYSLVEGLLITRLFYNLNLLNKPKKVFYFISGFLIILWIVDKFFITSIREFSSYFSFFASLAYVLMAISMINRLLLVEKKRIIRNGLFLICIGIIVFFTYALLLEIFWYYGLNSSRHFRLKVYRIMTYINLLTNLIYALAILWIPRKREYTLL